MLNKERAYELFERARKFSSADDVEVLIGGGKSALTRFANNTIHQNVADENYDISVRVQFGGKTARASTNKFDDESLRRTVRAAESLAKVQEEDADLLPMYAPEGEPASDVMLPQRRFAETAAIGPAERADAVAKMVDVARRLNLNSAGVYAVNDAADGIFNSRGVARWHEQTLAEVSVTMTAGNSSGWQKANAPDARELQPAMLAEIAAKKAVESANPREMAAGKYTVILEPAAVLDLVGFAFWDFGGLALLDQRSFLNNRFGKQVFGENITIRDDAYHPLQAGAAFDAEGVTRQKVELVRNGVVKDLVYARGTAERVRKSEYAAQLGTVKPTGHGFALPNEMGEAPLNIVFELAEGVEAKTVDQMVSETERGILVTRLWYIREVDPYEKMLTGMTRDGTFLVENGKVKGGVLNFRFNESALHMLSNVVSFGEPVRASGEESFDMVVPAMKVQEFNFTEVTRF